MGILNNVINLFKSTEAKVSRIKTIEYELENNEEIKNLLIDQYEDISKAINSDEFTCKEDIKFSDKEYIRQLAQIKSREKSLKNELDILKSNSDVIHYETKKKRSEAFKIVKSLYRSGKLDLDIYNKAVSQKDEKGRVKYADVIVVNNQAEFLLLKRSTFEDAHQGAWVIPGGHVDEGEDSEQAARRELREESGISIDKLLNENIITEADWYKAGEYKDSSAHICYYCLNIQNKEDVEILLDELETRDYQWTPISDIDNYPMVFNMASNIKKIMGWDNFPTVQIIKKAMINYLLNKEDFDSVFHKLENELLHL